MTDLRRRNYIGVCRGDVSVWITLHVKLKKEQICNMIWNMIYGDT